MHWDTQVAFRGTGDRTRLQRMGSSHVALPVVGEHAGDCTGSTLATTTPPQGIEPDVAWSDVTIASRSPMAMSDDVNEVSFLPHELAAVFLPRPRRE